MTLRLQEYSGAQVYAMSTTEETRKFHLVYSGTDAIHLPDGPQEIEVHLVRRDGNPALTGYFLAENIFEYVCVINT